MTDIPQSTSTDNSKLGLALSGGGFRASLFHIGVLAQMAEKNLLKEVEVISTVSGGSIIGAFYYLKIKELLEGKRKDNMKPSTQAYIKIVEEIEDEFLQAVRKNLRVLAFLNASKNLHMLKTEYSRSDRMAELYREHIYQSVWNNIKGSKGQEIFLHEIKIDPLKEFWSSEMDKDGDFKFEQYQQKAEYKIPVLIINATTLNTGNCWQFKAVKVGEKVRPAQYPKKPVININTELSQLHFDDSKNSINGLKPKFLEKRKKKLSEITLGYAVASSACVPVIFPPFALHDLYTMTKINRNGKKTDEECVVQLVDGGVFDNQGIYTLIDDQQCGRVICSDASSQLEDDARPSISTGFVLQRTNDILMDRVRDHEVSDLYSKAGVKDTFLHLRDRKTGLFPNLEANHRELLLNTIASIRTDLDSFTDIEAYTLMYTGYKMSEEKMFFTDTVSKGNWKFMKIENKLNDPNFFKKPLKHLEVSKYRMFKAFRLSLFPYKILAWFATIPLIIILGIIGYLGIKHHIVLIKEFTSRELLITLFSIGLLWFIQKIFSKKIAKWVSTLRNIRYGIWWLAAKSVFPYIIVFLIAFAAQLHLRIFDKIFLWAGRVK